MEAELMAEEVVKRLKLTREVSGKEIDHFDGIHGFASALMQALERWTREGRGTPSTITGYRCAAKATERACGECEGDGEVYAANEEAMLGRTESIFVVVEMDGMDWWRCGKGQG